MIALLFEVGVANAVLTAIIAAVVFVVTRIWKNPHLGRFLWLIVLLKMIAPPLLNAPIPFQLNWNQSECATSTSGNFVAPLLMFSSDDERDRTWKADAPSETKESPSTFAGTREALSKVMMCERQKYSLPIYLGTVWLTGSFAYGLLAGVRIVQFHRKLKETSLAGEGLQRIGRSVAKKLGLKLCPKLRITDSRLSPMVWPIGRPSTVVLPSDLVFDLEEDQMRAILAHEFGHIVRRDCWVRWLEVVCAVLYWWNPCLWLARREIRRAEELCCDAYVMETYPGCSSSFGESLLRVDEFLSGIPVGVPLLVSEMRGGGHLKRRIDMIIKEQLPPRPSRAMQIVLFVLTIAILPLSAQEYQGEPTAVVRDNQVASIDEIIVGLRKSESGVNSIEVEYAIESTSNFTRPGEPLSDEMKGLIQDDAIAIAARSQAYFFAMADGRFYNKVSALGTNQRHDDSQVHRVTVAESAFDGKRLRDLRLLIAPDGTVHRSGRNTELPKDYFPWASMHPFRLSLHDYIGIPISKVLDSHDVELIERESEIGSTVLVVETKPFTRDDGHTSRRRIWVDPARNYAIVRRQILQPRNNGEEWVVHHEVDLMQHKEIQPGRWLPMRVETATHLVLEEEEPYTYSRQILSISSWRVNVEPASDSFFLELPDGNKLGSTVELRPAKTTAASYVVTDELSN